MTEPATLDYAMPELRTPSQRGKGSLAVAATILMSGLGHVIAGNPRRGLLWFVTTLILGGISLCCWLFAPAFPCLLVLIPCAAIFSLVMWIDAYRCGRHSSRRMLNYPAARYTIAIACVAATIFLKPVPSLLALPVRHFASTFTIPTTSMSPTVSPGDRILVHKLHAFKRFDIVAMTPDDPRHLGEIYIKRVVGFPGETIELFDGGVKVNGQLIDPPAGAGPYVSISAGPRVQRIRLADGTLGHGVEGNPIKLGADEYFFLGDNSPISGDSRYWDWSVDGHQPGTLPRSHIKGVVTWIYWPPRRWRKLF